MHVYEYAIIIIINYYYTMICDPSAYRLFGVGTYALFDVCNAVDNDANDDVSGYESLKYIYPRTKKGD